MTNFCRIQTVRDEEDNEDNFINKNSQASTSNRISDLLN